MAYLYLFTFRAVASKKHVHTRLTVHVCILCSEIASVADEFQKTLLTSDADCSYDSVVEINLDTVG